MAMDAAETGETPTETASETSSETARLRRQLRAQSSVNRQLHAQLEGGAVRVSGRSGGAGSARSAINVRRVAEGGAWLEHLHLHGGGDPMLVRTASKLMFVIEGDMRRPVKAGMVFNALTRVLGPPREMTDTDLKRWSSGPPVEVMESGTGPAFVVVGGRRLPLRGLPLPYLVSTEDMLLFPEGEELNVGAAHAAPLGRSARVRKLLKEEGPVRGGAKIARKAIRRVTR